MLRKSTYPISCASSFTIINLPNFFANRVQLARPVTCAMKRRHSILKAFIAAYTMLHQLNTPKQLTTVNSIIFRCVYNNISIQLV